MNVCILLDGISDETILALAEIAIAELGNSRDSQFHIYIFVRGDKKLRSQCKGLFCGEDNGRLKIKKLFVGGRAVSPSALGLLAAVLLSQSSASFDCEEFEFFHFSEEGDLVPFPEAARCSVKHFRQIVLERQYIKQRRLVSFCALYRYKSYEIGAGSDWWSLAFSRSFSRLSIAVAWLASMSPPAIACPDGVGGSIDIPAVLISVLKEWDNASTLVPCSNVIDGALQLQRDFVLLGADLFKRNSSIPNLESNRNFWMASFAFNAAVLNRRENDFTSAVLWLVRAIEETSLGVLSQVSGRSHSGAQGAKKFGGAGKVLDEVEAAVPNAHRLIDISSVRRVIKIRNESMLGHGRGYVTSMLLDDCIKITGGYIRGMQSGFLAATVWPRFLGGIRNDVSDILAEVYLNSILQESGAEII